MGYTPIHKWPRRNKMRGLFVGDIPTRVAAIGTYLVQSLSAERRKKGLHTQFPLDARLHLTRAKAQ